MSMMLKFIFRLRITLAEIIKSKYFKKAHLYIFILFCIALLGFLFIKPGTPKSELIKIINYFLYNIVNFIVYNNNGFYDIDVRDFVKTLTNSFSAILSLLSAIYIFTYREQKTVAPSAAHNRYKNQFLFRVVFIILFVIITGYILQNYYHYYLNSNEPNTIHITNILHFKIYIWIASLIISVIHIVLLINYIVNAINVSKMLDNSISDTSRIISTLIKVVRINNFSQDKNTYRILHALEKKLDINIMISDLYEKLHYNIESIFQNLKFTANHNMNKEFERKIQKLKKEIIDKLKKSKTSKEKLYSVYLYENDQDKFVEFYRSFLRNILSLINYLYKEKHYNKARDLVSLYFSLYIESEHNLGRNFMDSLNEFLSSLDTNDSRQLRAFLDELNSITNSEQTLTTYHNLLIKLIIQDNIKVLTNVVYDFKNIIDIDKNEANKYSSYKRFIAQVQNKQLEKQVIYILLQCLLKSIEISHYASAGFLVKYLITNFSGEDINESLFLLKENPNLFAYNLERENLPKSKLSQDNYEYLDEEIAATKEISDINEAIILHEKQNRGEIKPFNINMETFNYCLKKLVVLLYGQQYYAQKKNLWFVTNDSFRQEIDIKSEFENCSYSDYIIKKVISASSKYGLIFFEDDETMNRIKSKCNIKRNRAIGFK